MKTSRKQIKTFENGEDVIVLIDDTKVEATFLFSRGIMFEVEIEGEATKVHYTKVNKIPREVCNRLNFGSRSGKLSDEEVAELRNLWGTMSRKEIADMFGISTSYAYKLATGRAAKAVRTSLAA